MFLCSPSVAPRRRRVVHGKEGMPESRRLSKRAEDPGSEGDSWCTRISLEWMRGHNHLRWVTVGSMPQHGFRSRLSMCNAAGIWCWRRSQGGCPVVIAVAPCGGGKEQYSQWQRRSSGWVFDRTMLYLTREG